MRIPLDVFEPVRMVGLPPDVKQHEIRRIAGTKVGAFMAGRQPTPAEPETLVVRVISRNENASSRCA